LPGVFPTRFFVPAHWGAPAPVHGELIQKSFASAVIRYCFEL
jgi:hypothetical protein